MVTAAAWPTPQLEGRFVGVAASERDLSALRAGGGGLKPDRKGRRLAGRERGIAQVTRQREPHRPAAGGKGRQRERSAARVGDGERAGHGRADRRGAKANGRRVAQLRAVHPHADFRRAGAGRGRQRAAERVLADVAIAPAPRAAR